MLFILSWMNPSIYAVYSNRYPVDFVIQMRGEYYVGGFWAGHDFLLLYDGFDAYGILSVLDAGWRKGVLSTFVERTFSVGLGRNLYNRGYGVYGAGFYRGDNLIWVGLGDSPQRRLWAGFRGKVWALVMDVRVAVSQDFDRVYPVLRVYFLNVLGIHYPALSVDSASYMLTAGASSGFQYDSSLFYLEGDGHLWQMHYVSTFSKPAGSSFEMVLIGGEWLELSADIRKKLFSYGGVGTVLSGFFPIDRSDTLLSYEVYPYGFLQWKSLTIFGGYRVFSPNYMPEAVLGGTVDLALGPFFISWGGELFSRSAFLRAGFRWKGLSFYAVRYLNSERSLNRLYSQRDFVGFSIMSH